MSTQIMTNSVSGLQPGDDLAFQLTKENALHLPDLSDFKYGPIDDLATFDASSVSSTTELLEVPGAFEGDVWSFPKSDEKEQIPTKPRSWETFHDKSFVEPRTVYISEAGPLVFDAALAAGDGGETSAGTASTPGTVIQSGPLLASLLQLGLGRESVLYYYSEAKQSFCPFIADSRMSGYSLEVFQSLSVVLIDAGNKFKALRTFVEKTLSSTNSSVTLVALAARFSDILAALQIRMGDLTTPIRSLLQLRLLFERPNLMLTYLIQIGQKTQYVTTDEGLLSVLFEIVQDSEHSTSWLQPLTLRILASVSKPWLECVSGWLGLDVGSSSTVKRQCHLPSFVNCEKVTRKVTSQREVTTLEYGFEPHSMPSFISRADATVIFETGQSLRLLEDHQPEHPLVRIVPEQELQLPGLEWHFSWKDVERIQAQAVWYEHRLQTAIREFDLCGERIDNLETTGGTIKQDEEVELIGLSEEKAQAYISASIATIEAPLLHGSSKHGEAVSDVRALLDESGAMETFAPPVSLLPVLSFNPLISMQAYLTNRACLRLLFKEHGLRSHFSLLYRYNLLGDGVFASRLSHALFDPDLQTAERRKGHSRAGTAGLNLGSRETWPPASSELRLALMGILSESYRNAKQSEGGSSIFRSELPGGLSFSIRDMSEDELQRCMNPDSIEALDFLKLDYRPPSPLDAVITKESLLKYDAVFKLLLRAARMLFVINQLYRDTKARPANRKGIGSLTHSFRIESHHFVSVICNYFYEGVQANWNQLEEKLQDVEKGLDGGGVESLSTLRDFHERMLDRMMFALILRKRQVQVKKLLEEIFGLVLQFARHIRLRGGALTGVGSTVDNADLTDLYEKFQKKVRVFVSVCRGLSGRRGQGGTKSDPTHLTLSNDENKNEDGGNAIGHLLLKLGISGFYMIE